MSIFPKFYKDWAKIVNFLLGHSDFKIAFLIKIMILLKSKLNFNTSWKKNLLVMKKLDNRGADVAS